MHPSWRLLPTGRFSVRFNSSRARAPDACEVLLKAWRDQFSCPMLSPPKQFLPHKNIPKHNNYSKTAVCSQWIHAFGRFELWAELEAVREYMRKRNIPEDVALWTTLLAAFGKAGKIKQMLSVHSEMCQRNVPISSFDLNCLLTSLGKHWDEYDEEQTQLQSFWEQFKAAVRVEGANDKNSPTFTVLIRAFAAAQNDALVDDVVSFMREIRFPITASFHLHRAQCYSMNERYDALVALYHECKTDNVEMGQLLWMAFVGKFYKKREIGLLHKLWMDAKGITFSWTKPLDEKHLQDAFRMLVQAFAQEGGALKQVAEVYDFICSINFPPNVVTFRTLLAAFHAAQDTTRVQQVYDHMCSCGLGADPLATNVVISHYLHAKNLDSVEKQLLAVWESLKAVEPVAEGDEMQLSLWNVHHLFKFFRTEPRPATYRQCVDEMAQWLLTYTAQLQETPIEIAETVFEINR
eukprot:TRINITY_DN48880_c0_g1_i1.p1 TRINITY_DN48880_c0_g1~~TRINITY_DN48880_c0_g1_i1.p1  ORF type:complete len:464 (-),score=25.16 TRINITY_DN48880_c0_g1_i1:146-1537(-)